MTAKTVRASVIALLLACGAAVAACSDSKSSGGSSTGGTGGGGGDSSSGGTPASGGTTSSGGTASGGSSAGEGGEGGQGNEDEFFSGQWIDHDGNMYVVDTKNCVIRRVDPEGEISTVAGIPGDCGDEGDDGPATEAKLNYPVDVAIGPDGDLYIADASNKRVRRVDAETGTISAFAGTGDFGSSGDGGPAEEAQLSLPLGLVVDADGNVFIADAWDNIVRKVDAGTGEITTVAGGGMSTDDGPATNAQLYEPASLALDAAGNLYIGGYTVRKVDVDGNITTVAGNGDWGASGDDGPALEAEMKYAAGVAVDEAGNLYILDMPNHAVRKVDATTGVLTTIAGTLDAEGFAGEGDAATDALLQYPGKLAFDRDGHLYIGDTYNHRIRRVDATSGIITTVVGTGMSGFDGDGGPASDSQIHEPFNVLWHWD